MSNNFWRGLAVLHLLCAVTFVNCVEDSEDFLQALEQSDEESYTELSVEEQLEAFNDSIQDVENDFIEGAQDFLEQQKLADKMIEANPESPNAYALKKISNEFMRTKCYIYAIWTFTMSKTKQILKDQFADEEAAANIPSDLRLSPEELEQFAYRTGLRAVVDLAYHSEGQWKLLSKLLEHYAGANTTPELSQLAKDVVEARSELSPTAIDKLQAIAQISEDRGAKMDDKSEIERLDRFDRILDDAILQETQECSRGVPQRLGEEYLNLKLMFASECEVEGLVRKYVKPELLQKLDENDREVKGKVLEFGPNELD